MRFICRDAGGLLGRVKVLVIQESFAVEPVEVVQGT